MSGKHSAAGRTLDILQLYPRDMNIYGDWGNVLAVIQRAKAHGYEVVVHPYNPGDAFPDQVDLVLGGGGQDSGQGRIQDDLLTIGPRLREMAEDGVPMLVICGLYQLFGKFFKTASGETVQGIGLLDIETNADPERRIGNIVVDSPEFGQVVGYENHSGQTFLGPGVKPLGTAPKGEGNNGQDGTEGARHRNVVGTYLHGSVLPKNPRLTDFLIRVAAERRYGDFTPVETDDYVVDAARKHAMRRPR